MANVKIAINNRNLAKFKQLLVDHVEDCLTHGVVDAKSSVNIDTTSLQRSIRILPGVIKSGKSFQSYVAGGVGYNEPLNDPVDYGWTQEEIFYPYMEPSLQAVLYALGKERTKRLFSGSGEHLTE